MNEHKLLERMTMNSKFFLALAPFSISIITHPEFKLRANSSSPLKWTKTMGASQICKNLGSGSILLPRITASGQVVIELVEMMPALQIYKNAMLPKLLSSRL